jgi:dienelactone hydrolase
MSQMEELQIESHGALVISELFFPARSSDLPMPFVLLCGPAHPHEATSEQNRLMDDLMATLTGAGLAVATFHANRSLEGLNGQRVAMAAAYGIDDASAVLRTLARRHDVNPQRIGVAGYGLGGMVAACLAGRSSELARVCLISPLEILGAAGAGGSPSGAGRRDVSYANDDGASGRGRAAENGGGNGNGKVRAPVLTPAADIAIHDRPTLILHGAADRVVPPECAGTYLTAIESAGRHAEHVLIGGGDHEFTSISSRQACLSMVSRFFQPLIKG